MTPKLKTKNLDLRPTAPRDLDRVVEIMTEPSVARWWHREDWAKEYIYHEAKLVWAIEKDGRMIGLIQAYEENDPQYHHAGIDLALSEEFQGQGFGPEAIVVVAKLLFDRGHHRLIIDPAASNERAIQAYQRVGFKPVGIMRQYEQNVSGKGFHDGLLMDMLKGELKES